VKLENAFEVNAPPAQAWSLLVDVPRVVPCMPGAELVETLGGDRWRVTMGVRLGAISFSFDTDLTRQEADEKAHRTRLAASARETHGQGMARATIESTLSEIADGTHVEIVTDLVLFGPVAVYGRGLIADVSAELARNFAMCLQTMLEASPDDAVAVKPKAPFGRLGEIFRRR
jgi:carbon monoxide dehydrogenase subunit G